MGAIIEQELANRIIREFQTQNTAAGGPALKTADGQYLQGFFMERELIEAALASNPNNTGLTVYLAKNPHKIGSPDNIFTLVVYGAEPNPAYQPDTNTQPYINNSNPTEEFPPLPYPYPPFPSFPSFILEDSTEKEVELESI